MDWFTQKTLGLLVKTNGMLSKPLLGGMGHVFMLHRVLPEKERNEYTLNRDLAITPEMLGRHIRYFASLGYDFISLDRLYECLTQGITPKRKFVCFTLDDGYKDNLIHGFPVFEKYRVPFAIYVTNCFPNHSAILWWYLLENTIKNKSSLELETVEGVKRFSWKNEEEGLAQYNIIRQEIRKIPKAIFRTVLLKAFETNESELKKTNENMFLSWQEIRELSNEKLVNIGAHTMNHLSLKSLTDAELVEEIADSKKEIEKYTGKDIMHFAYPYGGFEDASTREYDAVKKIGFKTATLNYPGNIFRTHKNHLEALPRMALGNATSPEKLQHIINGITHFSYNGLKKTVR